jgi:hypothetical protein
MSCDLANGRLEVCKDSIAGLDAAYFINFGDFNPEVDVSYSATAGEGDIITAIANVTACYKFELKGTNSYQETITSDRNNGTTFFQQELTITLKKQDAISQKIVKLLSYGRPHIIVRGRDNTYRIAGLKRGMDLTAGTIGMGTEPGDLNGYTLTFTGMESSPANFINCTTEAGLLTDLTALASFTTS